MHNEEALNQQRLLNRLMILGTSLGILALLLMILNLGYDLVVAFALTDCSFG
ncbi:hypothetical protein [Pseudomonas subflava]|uniref:hypothetical protein n=1 Tax=Pseudomonas subflava TaxID=2952933 RepID=UPI00207A2A63|nr:hypothetical protein [Pseudomonas subflava]